MRLTRMYGARSETLRFQPMARIYRAAATQRNADGDELAVSRDFPAAPLVKPPLGAEQPVNPTDPPLWMVTAAVAVLTAFGVAVLCWLAWGQVR